MTVKNNVEIILLDLGKFASTEEGICLVYDVTSKESFNSNDDRVKKLKYKFLANFGIKSDLKRMISSEEGKNCNIL